MQGIGKGVGNSGMDGNVEAKWWDEWERGGN